MDDIESFIFNPQAFRTSSIATPFRQQEDFVNDNSTSIAACCTRQAGKSTGIAKRLIRTMINHPKSLSRFIALTHDSAREIMWQPLHEEVDRLGIEAEFQESNLTVKLSNGSRLRIYGALTKNFMERLRGPKTIANAIDETQSFPDSILKPLINDIITPSMAYYGNDAWLALTGTPGPMPKGYWHEVISEGKYGYNVHQWKINHNPHIPNAEAYLAQVLKKHNWTIDTPTFQREYMGLWVQDFESLYIKWKENLNHYNKLPIGDFTYIIGVDFGFNDANFISVIGWTKSSPEIYLVEEEFRVHEIPSDFATRIKAMIAKYKPIKVMADEGALGKGYATEMRKRHAIPLQPANKPHKDQNAALLNDFLRRGLFKAKKDSIFVEDSFKVQIDYDKSTQTKLVVKGHSDSIDACLYAFKESPAWSYKEPEPKPKVGTPQWAQKEVDRMEEAAFDFFKKMEELEKGQGY